MKLRCGNSMVEIKMYGKNGIDWSDDFFNAGTLPYDGDLMAFTVDDIDDCIDAAKEWERGEGDYETEDDDERYVEVEELDLPPVDADGRYVTRGDWITDSTGIYVVQDVGNRVSMYEIEYEDDGEHFHLLDDMRVLTREEIKKVKHF